MHKKKKKRRALKMLSVSGVGLLFDSMDVGILAFVLAALQAEWGLAPTEMGFIGTINFIGMALGAALAGLWADRYGRKQLFIITLLIYSIATGLNALATSLIIFMVFRFIVGFGLGGELPVVTTYVLESAPQRNRAKWVVWLQSFWAGGALLAAVISYFVIPEYGWRIALFIGALPALYALYLRRALPETPAFTRQTNQQTIGQKIKLLWSASYRRTTFVLWLLWFASVFSYYGMLLWMPSIMVMKGFTLIKSFEYVLLMTLVQIPGYFTAAYFVDKWSKKATLVTFMVLAALSSLTFGLSPNVWTLLISGVCLSFFNLGAWGATYAYTAEQYPTSFRATGTGWAAGFGRIAGIIAPYLVGLLISIGIGFPYIFTMFFTMTMLAVLVVLFFGKESGEEA
ncbi:MFS transporter [Aneurinibacillus thermoaerophilus]|uniref:MFS transporter n=1 Tax=Aneurinibacillus thermoaerophilus TaxID=143495 RepID=A0A1G7XTG9_ANETH|nr:MULTISPECIES: MFS transporter [Aneurinibacillus]AMA73744.1 MFS transporter [Aneurinibacillus sp. XH2]MED0677097.1 MFS transporter [Aneurinibacillus thermoaerophilus]MED0756407.1 MFS transporter [Aneurinibacillus thermoaerophilus]MED0761194.1 MFS transporter [Aneurinibacillus thermoaerophilus]QYY43688.1 MFS transporter [Aneurinibacillus thermoaerophilus]